MSVRGIDDPRARLLRFGTDAQFVFGAPATDRWTG